MSVLKTGSVIEDRHYGREDKLFAFNTHHVADLIQNPNILYLDFRKAADANLSDEL